MTDVPPAVDRHRAYLPAPVLTVGVTGHRHPRLPLAATPLVEAAVGHSLERIRVLSEQIVADHRQVYADRPILTRLVTSLAEGSDTIAATAAMNSGYQVDSCLPFPVELYAEDFPGKARDAFRDLVARSERLLILPGKRRDTQVAYETAGRVVLDQSDILLAVWDGDPALGRGGTAQILAEAVASHVPVILVGTMKDEKPLILWSGLDESAHDRPTLEAVSRIEFDQGIERLLLALLAPPTNDLDRSMIRRWVGQADRRRTPALGFPLLMALAGGRPLTRADFHPPSAAACQRPFEAWLEDLPARPPFVHALEAIVAPRFGRADSAAAYFAQLFRTGFVTNYGFAALAVLFALLGLVVPGGKAVFIVAELAIIAIILGNTSAARRRCWHERWMDNRHLAERLRLLALSATLCDPALRADDHDVGSVPGWVRWMSRATAREIGLPDGEIDATFVEKGRRAVSRLIDDQLAYHRRNATQMARLDHRLHRLGELLFAGTIVACSAWLILYLVGSPLIRPAGVGATQWVTVVTAFLPALGAAAYGIRMQGDFHGMAHRSTTTVRLLEGLARVLARDPADFTLLRDRVKRLGDIMLMDVAHWRTTYQARPLHLPG